MSNRRPINLVTIEQPVNLELPTKQVVSGTAVVKITVNIT